MGECMIRILSDPELAERLGQAARRMAETHAVEHTLTAHERVYEDLLARRSASRRD